MGFWGVKATESDYGLDLLAVVEKKHLRNTDFKQFHVKEATELLKKDIMDKMMGAARGRSHEETDFYIQETFPDRYDQAVVLLAECLADYYRNGELIIEAYGTGGPSQKRITELICTDDDLNNLLADLQNVLEPEHGLYRMWKGSEHFDEWQAHINLLCETLQKQREQQQAGTPVASKADLYVDYINESILPRIDYGALQQSYETADKSYAKGILNHLHEAMVGIYSAETLCPDYNKEMEENFVVIPGVVQGKKTGNIALALLELDLSSSGEHWGTSFLCKYGVLPQSGGKLPTETAAPFVNAFIPYDYGYTATIPNDIHIRHDTPPDGIKDMLATFREHTAELLPPEPPRYPAENPPQDENEDDLER